MNQKNNSRKKTSLIYIGGYGRSGSTLLDIILSNNEKIIGLGEIVAVPLNKNESVCCSCGKELFKCEFFSRIFSKNKSVNAIVHKEMVSSCRKMEHRNNIIKNFLFKRKNTLIEDYSKINNLLFGAIYKFKSPIYILDSSKNAPSASLRPITLKKYCGCNIKLIHLVRDCRGVIWSIMKGSNKTIKSSENKKFLFPTIRAIFGWISANIITQLASFFIGKQNYLRIYYEDIENNPDILFKKIGEFLNLDLSPLIKKCLNSEAFLVAHKIGGNRMNNNEKITIQIDNEWERKLPFKSHLLFWIFAWPLALLYGYLPKKR